MAFKAPRLKGWTDAKALRMTNARYRRIDELLQEIAYIWGGEDEGIAGDADRLRGEVETAKLDAVLVAQSRAEERS